MRSRVVTQKLRRPWHNVFLYFNGRIAEGILHSWSNFFGHYWHTWKNHYNFTTRLDFCQRWYESRFLIGGIAENLKTSCADGSGDFFITEGDEYDTAFFDKRSKFFHYLPDQLVLNNLEFDHADIFASLEQIQQSFRWLLRLVPGNGLVVANGDDDNLKPVLEQIYSPLLTFGLGPDCNVRIEDIQICETGSQFRLEGAGQNSQQIWNLPMAGIHNIRNATAVILLAQHNRLSAEQIQLGFSSFQGVKRRQELRGTINDIWVYDDFRSSPYSSCRNYSGSSAEASWETPLCRLRTEKQYQCPADTPRTIGQRLSSGRRSSLGTTSSSRENPYK